MESTQDRAKGGERNESEHGCGLRFSNNRSHTRDTLRDGSSTGKNQHLEHF